MKEKNNFMNDSVTTNINLMIHVIRIVDHQLGRCSWIWEIVLILLVAVFFCLLINGPAITLYSVHVF